MPVKKSLKSCFETLGTIPKNNRWSWSGRSADGKRVSVTLWQDQFTDSGRIYPSVGFSNAESRVGSPGHNELIENLVWSEDKLDGIVSVIIAVAKDTKASPRSIKECFPVTKWRMKIASLDRSSGEFILQRTVD